MTRSSTISTLNPVLIALLPAALAMVAAGCAASGDAGNVSFGGAQDIGQFRDLLAQGEIPGENTLDANGFFNEHYTELPAPECGQVLCLHGMLAVGRDWLTDDYQATLQVAMNSPVDPATLQRNPLNLVAVIDTSGSMTEDNRIGFVKQGLHLLIDQLDDGDRLALVGYSSEVVIHSELQTELDRAALHQQVDNLVAAGLTNLHGGLSAGFDLAATGFDPARQNRVILLSDGLPTAGITNEQTILTMAAEYVSQGIGLTTIGVGHDFNVELMRGLAERGAGNFYFVEDSQAVEEVFIDELDYFVTPLALSVNIEVIARPGYDLGEVTGTRLWKAEGSTGTVFIPGVFLSSRTSDTPEPGGRRGGGSTLFIQMLPDTGVIGDVSEIAEIRLSYRLPDTGELLEQVVTVSNPTAPGVAPENPYYSHPAMAEQAAMYNIYLGLREATRTAVYDYNCALSQLITLDARAEQWNLEAADPDIAADRELIARFVQNLENRGAVRPDQLQGDACNGGYYYGDDYSYGACSAAGGNGKSGAGMLLCLLAAVALVQRDGRRRRRRQVA